MNREESKILNQDKYKYYLNRLYRGGLGTAMIIASLFSLKAYSYPYFIGPGYGPGVAQFRDSGQSAQDLSTALVIKEVADSSKAQQEYYSSVPAGGGGTVGGQGITDASGPYGYGMDGGSGVGYLGAEGAEYVGVGGAEGGGGGYWRTGDGGVMYVPNTGMYHTYVGQVVNVSGSAADEGRVMIVTDQDAVGDHLLQSNAPSYTSVSQQGSQ